jgi:hypothetical protein
MNDEVRLDYGTNTELQFWRTIASAPRRSDCEARLREEIGHVTHLTMPRRTFGSRCLAMLFR